MEEKCYNVTLELHVDMTKRYYTQLTCTHTFIIHGVDVKTGQATGSVGIKDLPLYETMERFLLWMRDVSKMDLTHMLEVNFYRDITLNWAKIELEEQLSQVYNPDPAFEQHEMLAEYIQNMLQHPMERKELVS